MRGEDSVSCGTPRTSAAPIHVARGASKVLTFTVRADPLSGDMSAAISGLDPAGSGALVDLTGAKVWFTVKNRLEDPGALFAKRNAAAGGVDNQVLVVVPQTGIALAQFRVILDPADTSPIDPWCALWCDAFVQMPGGPPINRQQVAANRQLVIDPAVTTNFF